MTDETAPERRKPDWWALEPAITKGNYGAEVGYRSEVTNHYIVEVTREISHRHHRAEKELGLRVEHKLAEVVDEYDRVHSDIERIKPIYGDTLAGRRLINRG